MRFLGIGETCDLGALYLSLLAEGHEVRVAISEPEAQGTLAGLIERSHDWRKDLEWVRAAGSEGVILFEAVSEGLGARQDDLRRQGFNVVGGSAYGDRLENDRSFAQAVLGELGFPNPDVWTFRTGADAEAFIARRPGRYVLKYSGADRASSDNYIGQTRDGRDVAALLRQRHAGEGSCDDIMLMAFVDGVEMGVGAYFNGKSFIRPACLDWEHKRFFAGDLGELTGEMGTVVTYDRTDRFFDLTLRKMESRLRDSAYVGYVNLNTIVNAEGIWPLEFSCRFGYPGFAVLTPLQATPWGALFKLMTAGEAGPMATRPGFCVGVVLTTPPFPYTRKQVAEPVGLPILFEADIEPAHFHFGEMGLDATGQLVTAGLYGWTMVVTGVGATVSQAQLNAYANVRRVTIPNMRYRLDIGDRLKRDGLAAVEALSLLSASDL